MARLARAELAGPGLDVGHRVAEFLAPAGREGGAPVTADPGTAVSMPIISLRESW